MPSPVGLRQLLNHLRELFRRECLQRRRLDVSGSAQSHQEGHSDFVTGSFCDTHVVVLPQDCVEGYQLAAHRFKTFDRFFDPLGCVLDVLDSLLCQLHQDDVARFATLLRAESNLHLDRRNPSLKTDLDLFDMNLRVSASLPPLSPDGLHLEIRRARRRPFTILDLIRNGTLPTEAAAALLLALGCRFNITITGGPGTGKTTLLNALDLDSPKAWRKIYIEDAVESRNLQNHHQVRFKVDPVDETDGYFDKSLEIVKTLHRSPDYLILGEIQTAEHSQALFQAIAAGLRAMQTCHSYSAASLVSRWTTGHDIEKSSIAMMDLIVTMVRPVPGESSRRVSEIVEVRRTVSEGVLEFTGLSTVYNYHSSQDLQWTSDGAFLSYARETGHESHIKAYDAIVDLLTRSLQTSSNDAHRDLGKDIWSLERPLWFAGV